MAGEPIVKTIPLSKTTKFIVDNRGKTAPIVASGIALIATNCVTNSHLYPLREKLRFVSQETCNTWFRAHPQPGDILLTNKGSQNGAVCLVPDPVNFVIAQDMVALRPDAEVIDPLFLFAALRSPEVQHQIRNLDVSGVIPHFKKGDFDKLLLPYPDRHTQEAIGQIYFHLSAKIELNRRTNETLEAMARALFKSWFVDFDPVRAKAEGRDAGLPQPLADLFPARLIDSKLGEIPEGWEVGSLGTLGELAIGESATGGRTNPFLVRSKQSACAELTSDTCAATDTHRHHADGSSQQASNAEGWTSAMFLSPVPAQGRRVDRFGCAQASCCPWGPVSTPTSASGFAVVRSPRQSTSTLGCTA